MFGTRSHANCPYCHW